MPRYVAEDGRHAQAGHQGQAFAAKITLTPDGADKAKVTFDVMDGQFVMEGTGVKK